MEKPSWETAADFFNQVRGVVTRVTREQLDEELERLEAENRRTGTQQTANPNEVLIDLIFDLVEDTGEFEVVSGVLGVHPHRWYEWSYLDLTLDPLPLRYIVDPVPLGSYSRPLGWAPNSPFAVLYIKEVDRSKGEVSAGPVQTTSLVFNNPAKREKLLRPKKRWWERLMFWKKSK